jgi:hypothetical protein
MGLDIRIPIGSMFTLIGLLLVVAGLIHPEFPPKGALQININLIWGSVLLVFGVLMWGAAILAKRNQK